MNLAQSGLNLDTDDLKQAGNLGLWKAVPKFDLTQKPQKSQALFRQVKYLSTVLESAMSEISYFVTENIFHRTDLLLSLLQYHTTVKKSFQNLMLFQEVSCMYARPNRLSRALNTLPAKAFRIVLANVIWIGQL